MKEERFSSLLQIIKIPVIPCKGYAVYLVRKHTLLSNTEIGRYFGNIRFSVVTKIVTRLKAKMKEDKGLKAEIDETIAKLYKDVIPAKAGGPEVLEKT